MSFDFVAPQEFFRLLYQESEFCDGVGKVMLAAGMLETDLSEVIEESVLPGHQLVDVDVHMFVSKAQNLAGDFLHFAKHVASADPSKNLLL